MDDIKRVKDDATDALLEKPNVCGTAVGYKWKDSKPTDEPAILVFVQKKIAHNPNIISKFSADDLIPPEIQGIRTDVIEVGNLVKQTFKQKVRPIRPGYSCGHGKITAGTMGGIFLDPDGDLVILTNNHVGANENDARPGDIFFQPGPADNRKKPVFSGWGKNLAKLPYIGTLKKFVKLKKKGNLQDSAIVKIHPKLIQANLVNPIYPVVNKPLKGFSMAKTKMQVQKCGRTTGYTTGQIIGLHASFSIGYDFGTARFDDCIVTTAMSKGGDSGSLICDMGMRAVGLLFAGSAKVTIANPIQAVVDHYGLRIWNGSGFAPPPNQKPGQDISLGDSHWKKFTTDGNIAISNNGQKAVLTENANQHCFMQCRIDNFSSVSCKINTGTIGGATWGPGIVVQWPTGMMKVNLRKGSTFGGYFNTNANINIGQTKANTDYVLRIRKTNKSYIGEVLDSGRWYTVIELPRSIFPMDPTFVRVGKTGKLGSTRDYAKSGKNVGPVGTCTITNVKIG